MTPRRTAAWLVIVGFSVGVIGIALLSVPLAIITAGIGITLLGLLAVEVTKT